MFIYIVRHAWAGHFGDPEWPDDTKRPLTDTGSVRFTSVVRRLVKRGFAPQRIATSPMVRCRQTADIIVAEVPGEPEVVALDALLPGSDLAALLRWTTEQNSENVCWIGHAPDVANLTAALVGDPAAHIHFAKGACASVRMEAEAKEGTGRLCWLATAKLLGC